MSDCKLPRMLRLASASIAGTALEYYDFAVYNTLAALVFNKLFFPTFDPMSGTLLSFATFWVGYLSRPFGDPVWPPGRSARAPLRARHHAAHDGHHDDADRAVADLLRRSACSRPILLVTLRFAQGVALGGEWAGAVLLSVEHGS